MMSTNSENIEYILADFIHKLGALAHFTYNGVVVQLDKRTKFQKILQKVDIKKIVYFKMPQRKSS